MRMTTVARVVAIASCLPLSVTEAYDIGTHMALTAAAVAPPDPPNAPRYIHGVLVEDLMLSGGVETVLRGRTVSSWLADGAAREDSPALRVLNHFHNPLKPWESAGLQFGVSLGRSSILWGQDPDQDITGVGLGGTWSWPLARQRFLDALMAATPTEREALLAQMFRALGHLTHLVQDATVPAHVRNDPHLVKVNQDPYEDWVELIRKRLPPLERLGPSREPPGGLLTPTFDPAAPVPIARLLDADHYDGSNPGLLTIDVLGIAEFTNGNFLSGDTRFSPEFPYPSLGDLERGPSDIEGDRVRQYFTRQLNGVHVERFVAEGMLFQPVQTLRGRPLAASFVLNDKVHEEYARYLIPRAIGYSTALLDYFFRGRLGVDVEEDPARPGAMRLTGVNRSREELGAGGELAVLGEDGSGRRFLLGQERLISDVPPGGVLPGVALDDAGLEGSHRFAAVYRGPLGHEKPDPGRSMPGAVIGKIFDATRVEEVYAEGDRWKVRTAQGVFALPLATADHEHVQWGDDPDMLVARSRLGPAAPNRVGVYRLVRTPGAVPFALAPGTSVPTIQLTPVQEREFPLGLDTGTRVLFSHVVDYRQQLTRIRKHVRVVFDEAAQRYQTEEIAFTVPEVETTVDEPGITFANAFGIVLAPEHHVGVGQPPYTWEVVEIAADRQGRPLAVVLVSLTQIDLPPRALPVWGVDERGATVETGRSVFIVPRYPEGLPAVWMVVDLVERRIVASTADPVIEIALRETRVDGPARILTGQLGYYLLHTATHEGGPRHGEVQVLGWLPAIFETGVPAAERVTEIGVEGGLQSLEVRGMLRAGLRGALSAAGFVDHGLTSSEPVTDLVYGCTRSDPIGGCEALRLRGHGISVGRTPASLDAVRRPRGALDGRLVILATDYSTGNLPLAAVVVWDPTSGDADIRYRPVAGSPGDAWDLAAATSRAVLVVSTTFDSWPFGPLVRASVLAPLDAGVPPAVLGGQDLRQGFVLLDPDRLYRTTDQKFYRFGPPLMRTPLPARLAEAPPHPRGDLHVVGPR